MIGVLGLVTGLIVGGVLLVASVGAQIGIQKGIVEPREEARQKKMENLANKQAKKQILRDAQNYYKTLQANAYPLAKVTQEIHETKRKREADHQRQVDTEKAKQIVKNREGYNNGSPTRA